MNMNFLASLLVLPIYQDKNKCFHLLLFTLISALAKIKPKLIINNYWWKVVLVYCLMQYPGKSFIPRHKVQWCLIHATNLGGQGAYNRDLQSGNWTLHLNLIEFVSFVQRIISEQKHVINPSLTFKNHLWVSQQRFL